MQVVQQWPLSSSCRAKLCPPPYCWGVMIYLPGHTAQHATLSTALHSHQMRSNPHRLLCWHTHARTPLLHIQRTAWQPLPYQPQLQLQPPSQQQQQPPTWGAEGRLLIAAFGVGPPPPPFLPKPTQVLGKLPPAAHSRQPRRSEPSIAAPLITLRTTPACLLVPPWAAARPSTRAARSPLSASLLPPLSTQSSGSAT